MTNVEFQTILTDGTKVINGDIVWIDDEDHSPTVEFRAPISSESGYPLFVRGSYNALAETLSYVLICQGVGRIYALDLGKDHHNPSCTFVGEKHKHRWDEVQRDKEAYVPDDITATASDPIVVWHQFCMEANLRHEGTMRVPPPVQLDLL